MSVRIISNVWDHSQAKLGARLVMLALADACNDAGVCWPGIDRVAQKTHVSKRQVQRILPKLKETGELYYEQGVGPHGTNKYFITLDMTLEQIEKTLLVYFQKPQTESQPLANAILRKVTNCHPPDVGNVTPQTVLQNSWGVTSYTEKVSKMSPEPSLEPSLKIKEEGSNEPSIKGVSQNDTPTESGAHAPASGGAQATEPNVSLQEFTDTMYTPPPTVQAGSEPPFPDVPPPASSRRYAAFRLKSGKLGKVHVLDANGKPIDGSPVDGKQLHAQQPADFEANGCQRCQNELEYQQRYPLMMCYAVASLCFPNTPAQTTYATDKDELRFCLDHFKQMCDLRPDMPDCFSVKFIEGYRQYRETVTAWKKGPITYTEVRNSWKHYMDWVRGGRRGPNSKSHHHPIRFSGKTVRGIP